jgi:hypothetical protein
MSRCQLSADYISKKTAKMNKYPELLKLLLKVGDGRVKISREFISL